LSPPFFFTLQVGSLSDGRGTVTFIIFVDVGTLACNWIIHNIFYLSSENGVLWQIWEEPKNPDGGKIHSNFDFFIWNITNPAEVAKGLNPKLAEIGPYCFMNFVKKVDIREENDSGNAPK
jgi:hypothetical protein